MKLVNIPSYIDEHVINYIDEKTKRASSSEFDENSFLDWLEEYGVKDKQNPSAYIKACFKKELDRGTFKPKAKVKYMPNTQVLINEMRDRGICVLADEYVWVDVLFNYLLNEKKIDGATCRELNHLILNYMTTKDFREYKELLMKSKTLKPIGVDWEYIENKTKASVQEWNAMLDDIEKLESEE